MHQIKTMLIGLIVFFALFAGDSATFINLGFSKDGKYFSFGQYGYHDGSGFPYADLFVVNVKTNSFVPQGTFRVIMEDTEHTVLENSSDLHALLQAISDAQTILQQYEIKVRYLGNDFKAKDDFVELKTKQKSIISAQLHERKVPKNYDPFDGGKTFFHISLNYKGKTHTLGNKNRHRKGIFAYGLSSVIRYKSAIVCIVSKSSLGFEGPDHRYMVETFYGE